CRGGDGARAPLRAWAPCTTRPRRAAGRPWRPPAAPPGVGSLPADDREAGLERLSWKVAASRRSGGVMVDPRASEAGFDPASVDLGAGGGPGGGAGGGAGGGRGAGGGGGRGRPGRARAAGAVARAPV